MNKLTNVESKDDFARLLGNFPQFPVTVQMAGKLTRKAASSSLVSVFSLQFSHRMTIRCFLTGFFGQEDEPS